MKEILLKSGRRSWTLQFPSTYSEMTPAQYRAAVRHTTRLIGEAQFWKSFIGMPISLYDTLPEWVRMQLREQTEFIPKMNEALGSFLIPSFRMGLRRVHAPESCLSDMCLSQFMAIDSMYSYYICEQKEDFLNKMVACTYLEKGVGFYLDKQHKQLLDMDAMAAHMAKGISPFDKYAVFLNWVLIKNWLNRNFRHLFPKGAPYPDEKPQPADWLALFDSFVGDNVPYLEQYQRMSCMDAFRIIDRKIEQQHKMKKK